MLLSPFNNFFNLDFFNLDLKIARVGAILIASGNLFHRFGPITTNARSPLYLDLVLGTVKSARSLDLSDLEGPCLTRRSAR